METFITPRDPPPVPKGPAPCPQEHVYVPKDHLEVILSPGRLLVASEAGPGSPRPLGWTKRGFLETLMSSRPRPLSPRAPPPVPKGHPEVTLSPGEVVVAAEMGPGSPRPLRWASRMVLGALAVPQGRPRCPRGLASVPAVPNVPPPLSLTSAPLSPEFCENLSPDCREAVIMGQILPCIKVRATGGHQGSPWGGGDLLGPPRAGVWGHRGVTGMVASWVGSHLPGWWGHPWGHLGDLLG